MSVFLHMDTTLSQGGMTELPGKKPHASAWLVAAAPKMKADPFPCFAPSASLWATDHYQPLRIFSGHLADVTCTRFHPNSNYVATGSSDRTIRLWDVLTGNCVRIFTGHKVRTKGTECDFSYMMKIWWLICHMSSSTGADSHTGFLPQWEVLGFRGHW